MMVVYLLCAIAFTIHSNLLSNILAYKLGGLPILGALALPLTFLCRASFIFTGRRITKLEDDDYMLNQQHHGPCQRSDHKEVPARDQTSEGRPAAHVFEFGSRIGSLQRMSDTTRPDMSPDMASDVSLLQAGLSTHELE